MKFAYLFLLFKLVSLSFPASAFLDVYCLLPAEYNNTVCDSDQEMILTMIGDMLNDELHALGLVPEEENVYSSTDDRRNLRGDSERELANHCRAWETQWEQYCLDFASVCGWRRLLDSNVPEEDLEDLCDHLANVAQDNMEEVSVNDEDCADALKDHECYCKVLPV
jgi:hypothetical protein